MQRTRAKQLAAASVLVVGGFGAGVLVAMTGSASADTGTGTYAGPSGRAPDPTRSMRPDEHLLTGTTAAKVRAAALAKYPRATIQRVETDSDGVYEAHVVTSAGQWVTVQVGKDFAVTGTRTGGPGGGPGGDHDGDGPAGPPPAQGGNGA
ncbi:MAG: hypothetical protein ACXVWU_09530 [Nocardioides sp.]